MIPLNCSGRPVGSYDRFQTVTGTVSADVALILAAIHTRRQTRVRAQLLPPRGETLIDELKVQRCLVREFYMRVIFLLVFAAGDREGPMYAVYCFIYCCWCARLSRRGCVRTRTSATFLHLSLASFMTCKMELFKGDKIDRNRLQPDQIAIRSILTTAKIKMSFACSRGAAGSQGHMARFKIYTLSVCCVRACVRAWVGGRV